MYFIWGMYICMYIFLYLRMAPFLIGGPDLEAGRAEVESRAKGEHEVRAKVSGRSRTRTKKRNARERHQLSNRRAILFYFICMYLSQTYLTKLGLIAIVTQVKNSCRKQKMKTQSI